VWRVWRPLRRAGGGCQATPFSPHILTPPSTNPQNPLVRSPFASWRTFFRSVSLSHSFSRPLVSSFRFYPTFSEHGLLLIDFYTDFNSMGEPLDWFASHFLMTDRNTWTGILTQARATWFFFYLTVSIASDIFDAKIFILRYISYDCTSWASLSILSYYTFYIASNKFKSTAFEAKLKSLILKSNFNSRRT
jgi:hypothetical protein